MGKVRRGGFVFITWKGDHPPRHVHVYREGRLVVKWDLDNWKPMKGDAQAHRAHPGASNERRSVRVHGVAFNNRKRGFDVRTRKAVLWFPYARLEVRPTAQNPVVR